MIIFLAHHFIKPECVAAYREAILANAWLTSQEPGVLRFEVMQDTAARHGACRATKFKARISASLCHRARRPDGAV